MAADRPLPAPADDCVAIGSITSFLGAWASYYLDGATGGIIVVAQTLLFLLAFVFAPKHGLLASRRRAREAHP
ncbi:Manganese ABC transporter, inner membrane permease protein SitC [Enterobacter hormaechei]|nr:Manganese ABC transporter, inner membrane permease protein SitC [Enterobacter hormaechei]